MAGQKHEDSLLLVAPRVDIKKLKLRALWLVGANVQA